MIKNIFSLYFDYTGLTKNEYPVDRQIYCHTDNDELASAYRQYLIDLQTWHQERQNSIENKNSQIIGQVSVVIAIVALFIPLIVSNIADLPSIWTIVIVTFFLILLYHFSLAIIHATKTLEADKNRYMAGSTRTVVKKSRSDSQLTFRNEEIADLVQIINNNNGATNRLAANLVYATRCFKIGVIGFGIYSCLLLMVFINKNASQPQKIEIAQPVSISIPQADLLKTNQIKVTVDSLRNIIDNMSKRLDSLLIRNDSTNRK